MLVWSVNTKPESRRMVNHGRQCYDVVTTRSSDKRNKKESANREWDASPNRTRSIGQSTWGGRGGGRGRKIAPDAVDSPDGRMSLFQSPNSKETPVRGPSLRRRLDRDCGNPWPARCKSLAVTQLPRRRSAAPLFSTALSLCSSAAATTWNWIDFEKKKTHT